MSRHTYVFQHLIANLEAFAFEEFLQRLLLLTVVRVSLVPSEKHVWLTD